MSEGTIGILVLVGISVSAGLVFHSFIRHYIVATCCAALVADVGFQVAAYLHLGHLDPFFIVALVIGGGYAFAIAAVTGIPFVFIRKKRRNKP
jgi:hypothetical protein